MLRKGGKVKKRESKHYFRGVGSYSCKVYSSLKQKTSAEKVVFQYFIKPISLIFKENKTALTEKSFSLFLYEQKREDFVAFIRAIGNIAEKEHGTDNYHVRVCCGNFCQESLKYGTYPSRSVRENFVSHEADFSGEWFIYLVGRIESTEIVPAPDPFSSLEDTDYLEFSDRTGRKFKSEIQVKDMILLSDIEHNARAVFDGQGRAAYIVVSTRKIPNDDTLAFQRDLSDVELYAMWGLCVEASRIGHGSPANADSFIDIRINAGSFQNIRSIHYKVFVEPHNFYEHWKENQTFQFLRAQKTSL